MELHILNNPNLRPRDEVEIVRVGAQPSADGRRVNVRIEITPFQERPNLEIGILRDGRLVASTSAVAIMDFRVSFNLHLRGVSDPAGDYDVRVALYYDDANAPQDAEGITLHIPPAGA